MVGNRGHGHFIDFPTCGNQGTGGRLPIESQRRIPGRHQGAIHGSHERVSAHIPGFKVFVQFADTEDVNQDGIVLTQDPGPGSTAKPGTTVTITVGRYVAPTTTSTTTDTTTTTTDTTTVTQ